MSELIALTIFYCASNLLIEIKEEIQSQRLNLVKLFQNLENQNENE